MTLIFFLIPLTIWLALSAPALIKEQSLKRFCRALFISAFGVLIPLGVFLLSAFLVPEWKGGCKHGWLDCFHFGKLTLTPLVLWAIGAFYLLEMQLTKPTHSHGLVLGLFVGVIVAGGCFVYGVVSVGSDLNGAVLFLLVPLYVTLWNGIRLAQIVKQSGVGQMAFLISFISTIPFWIAGVFWSQKIFASLSDSPPDCFVVTAAGQGHRSFVGPFTEVTRRCHHRIANRQLITLWRFEELWQTHAPVSHASFRCIYNRVGPVIARRINSPWIADATYLAIKPIECVASLIVTACDKRDRHRQTYLPIKAE